MSNMIRPDFALNPMAAIVVAYNTVAEHLADTRPVTKFSDKPTAVARLNKVIDALHDAGYSVSYLPNGAIEEIVRMDPREAELVAGTDVEDAIIEEITQTQIPGGVIETSSGVRTSPLLDMKITVVAESNPKRAKSRTHARFFLYENGMTGAEYMEACLARELGVKREVLSDLHYDAKRGFIKLS